MEIQPRWPVPPNWAWARLSQIGDIVGGGTPSTKEPLYWGDEINWISPSDLTGYSSKMIRKGRKGISRLGLENSSAKVMPAGSVHFSSRAPIGHVVISSEPTATNQGFKSLVPASGVLNSYVYYYLIASREYARSRASGTTFLELSGKAFGELVIPVAPTSIQHAIVSKIEELISDLDAGIESLKKARAQLATYRQAVLKHAFEGKLTAHWREDNKDILETSEQLLVRIKQEREARYHQQIQEWLYRVKQWVDDKGGRKPVRPRKMSLPEPFTDEELVHLPNIPGLWRWSKLGEPFSVYVGATPNRKNQRYWNGGVNWISSGEVCFNTIDSTIETISQEGLASTSADIHPIGTVMLGMIGEGRTRGRAAITNIETCHNQNTAAIRVSETGMQPKFVYYYLLYRYEDTRRIGSGNNQRALNKERVSNLPIPLSALAEQSVLVEAIEEYLSTIDQIDREIVNSLTKANHLRQAILKRAFSGQLVSLDPNDEPASVCLDRIRAEREQFTKRPRHRKIGRRVKAKVTA